MLQFVKNVYIFKDSSHSFYTTRSNHPLRAAAAVVSKRGMVYPDNEPIYPDKTLAVVPTREVVAEDKIVNPRAVHETTLTT